jgi:hypothetical protein
MLRNVLHVEKHTACHGEYENASIKRQISISCAGAPVTAAIHRPKHGDHLTTFNEVIHGIEQFDIKDFIKYMHIREKVAETSHSFETPTFYQNIADVTGGKAIA